MFDAIKRKTDDHVCDKAITEMAQGNMEGLSVVYRIYGRMIFSVALQIVKNDADAEDVLQDVMLAVSQKAHQYTAGSHPRAWVMAVTRNRSLDKLREQRDTASNEASDRGQIVDDTSFASPFRSALLSDALGALSDEEQMMVRLKWYIGLSHAEIASVMGLTKSCAEKRYERAMDKMRKYFCEGE